jgi:hypothetical protein
MLHRTIDELRAVARERLKVMGSRKLFSAIGNIFTTFGSAVAVSRAVEAGRKPRADDLRKLGMDPAAFAKIGHF